MPSVSRLCLIVRLVNELSLEASIPSYASARPDRQAGHHALDLSVHSFPRYQTCNMNTKRMNQFE